MHPLQRDLAYFAPVPPYGLIGIKKEWGTIPEWKRSDVLATFNSLLYAYGPYFPFTFDRVTDSIYFRMQFSIVQLISFMKGKIAIDDDTALNGNTSYHFLIPAASLEEVSTIVVESLLYMLPIINDIRVEDLNHFRYMIRELAFKKISTIFNQEITFVFSNAIGPDVAITFSAGKGITNHLASLSLDQSPLDHTEKALSQSSPSFGPFFVFISKINEQLALKDLTEFDLTKRAMQEKKPSTDIAWAFIQDATRLAPIALRKVAPTIAKEIKALFLPNEADEILNQWMNQALLSDQELTLSLLEHCISKPVLKSFNKTVCTKAAKDKVPHYFLHRGAFAPDDPELLDEDLLALSLLPLNTAVPCFKIALDVALCRIQDFDKISLILEKAVSEDSTLWEKANELKKYSPITAEGCCHLLNACAPHFDEKSLLFWLKALLGCVQNKKKAVAASLNREKLIDSVRILNEPSIFDHKEIGKIFSKEELPLAYASFLDGVLERSIKASDVLLKTNAFNFYKELLPKLELQSEKEKAATSRAIQILCTYNDSVKSFFESLSGLTYCVVITEGHKELAKNSIDTLLWCETDQVETKNTKQANPVNLERWKSHFFEMAVTIMHTLLDAPSGDEKENSVRLEIVAQLIGGILRGNPKRELVVPIFEKMVFSRKSCCTAQVYQNNIHAAKLLYDRFIEKLGLFKLYPHHCYKTILMTHTLAWKNNPLQPQEQHALFTEVLDFLIDAHLPEALHTMCDIMRNSSKVLFGKDDDELRMSLLNKLIDAVFEMPDATVQVHSNSLYHNEISISTEHRIPLTAALVECIVGDGKQFITFDNKDASVKGYPLVKMVIERLIALFITKSEKFADIMFYLLVKASREKIITSEAQHVELLRLNLTAPMLQAVFAHESWEVYVENYFTLLTLSPPHVQESNPERIPLFLYFIKALLSSNNKKIFDSGRSYLNKEMTGLYKGRNLKEDGIMELLQRKF
ncbi:MAG: hypothetical protein JSR46_03325 [Verrucomicrobia bacterium]|nr:hypothetical protein [Verrucomicrobiota bacterium]